MVPLIVSAVLVGICAWLATGLVVALWLHAGKLTRMDPGTVGAGIAFRILVTPGMMALWPLLLRNWRRTGRVENPLLDPDSPVSAARLRSHHGLYVRAVAVVVPVACAVAIVARPAPVVNASIIPEPLRTPPLGRLVEKRDDAFSGHAVAMAVRSDGHGRRFQLEVDVAKRLTLREPMVYWMPGESSGSVSEFVGPLTGEGMHRFAISEGMVRGGSFAILSFRDATALGAPLPEEP